MQTNEQTTAPERSPQEIGIESSLLKSIASGTKYIEGRLGKATFLRLEEGDTLYLREDIWEDGELIDSIPDVMAVVVDQVLYFESFKEMLAAIDFTAAIPSATSIEDALAAYGQYYSPEDEKKYGVVALFIRPL